MPQSHQRSSTRLFLALVAILVVFVAWKGISLWMLGQAVNDRAAAVAEFYREQFTDHGGTMMKPGATLPPAAGEAMRQLRSSLDKLGQVTTITDRLTHIIGTQQSYRTLREAAGDAIKTTPSAITLDTSLSKAGSVQPLLDSYNQKAQAWNNERDTVMGRIFMKLFTLEPRILLRADGQAEYETTVSI